MVMGVPSHVHIIIIWRKNNMSTIYETVTLDEQNWFQLEAVGYLFVQSKDNRETILIRKG